jgi:acyl-CoA synthetase (AMP-forming)/AMP-acid ligase II
MKIEGIVDLLHIGDDRQRRCLQPPVDTVARSPPRSDTLNISGKDVIFRWSRVHVNAWGIPSRAMVGAKLVFPVRLDGKSVYELMEAEKVTLSAGVPTVWQGLLNYMEQNASGSRRCAHTIVGVRRCRPAMLRTFEEKCKGHCAACVGHDGNVAARHRVFHARLPCGAAGGTVCPQMQAGTGVYGVT